MGADVYVSLHRNSAVAASATGLEVLYRRATDRTATSTPSGVFSECIYAGKCGIFIKKNGGAGYAALRSDTYTRYEVTLL